jgi:hypothetical protein
MSSQPSYQSTLVQTPPLVPSETIEKERDTSVKPAEEFLPWMKKLMGRLRQENRKHNNAMWAKHLTNEQFYRGNQHGKVSDLDGTWLNFNRKSKLDPRYTHNLIRGHVSSIVASHVLARTDLEVLALPSDDADDHVQGQARSAGYVIDYYEHSIFTETFRIRESKLRQFGGGVGRYTIWDAKAGYQLAKRPKMEPMPFKPPVEDSFTCSFCGESGKLQDALEGHYTLDKDLNRDTTPECPYCHSADIAITKVEAIEMSQPNGYDSVPSGDCRTVSVPMYQLDFDRTGSEFEDALWLCWKRRFRPEVVKELFPWWDKVGGSSLEDSDEYGLKVSEYLKDSAGNMQGNFGRKTGGGKDESVSANLVDVEQWWLRPCMYGSAPALRKELKIGDPKNPSFIIPAGTKPRETFPDGMYLMVINKQPVDFRVEDFRQHWVYIPYDAIPSKIEGDGNEDMNEPQREVNMLDALMFTDIRMTAAPPTYYDDRAVKNKDLVGKPDVNVPVHLTRPDQTLQNVVYTPQGRQMPGHVPQYRDWLAQLMQWQSKASNTSTGMTMLADETGEKTATGAKLVAQGAANQRAPENAAMSDGDVKTARQWLKLFKENAIDERYLPLRGKTSGMAGTYLKGADIGEIDSNLLIIARPGSNTPRGPEDNQNAMGMALQMVGGLEGLMGAAQSAPEFLKALEDTFRVKFNVGGMDLDAQQSRMRMDAMKRAIPQALAQAQAMGNPDMAIAVILQSAPIRKYDNHQAAIKYLVEWFKQDEGIEAHPVLQMAAEARIEEHNQAIKGLQAEEMQDQMEQQAPMQEQAQAEQEKAMQMQAEQQGQQASQQMEMEAAKAEQDKAIRDEQRGAQIEDKVIEQEAKEEDHRRNLELEAVRQHGQKEIAKMKPTGPKK